MLKLTFHPAFHPQSGAGRDQLATLLGVNLTSESLHSWLVEDFQDQDPVGSGLRGNRAFCLNDRWMDSNPSGSNGKGSISSKVPLSIYRRVKVWEDLGVGREIDEVTPRPIEPTVGRFHEAHDLNTLPTQDCPPGDSPFSSLSWFLRYYIMESVIREANPLGNPLK